MSNRRKDAGVVITRRQLGRAGSLVGGLALVIALVLFIWQGELTGWGLAALVVGIGGLTLWMTLAPNDFQDWISGRTTRYGGNSLLGALVVIAIVMALYGWADAQNLAVDMTLPQHFTLGPSTHDVLDQLDRPVLLTGFYSSATQTQRDRDDAIFHLFEAEMGDAFRVVYVDPTENAVLAERFGAADGSAFLTFVDPESGEPDLGAIVPIDLVDAQERAVANSLLQLMAAGRFKIYFTVGHGEPDPTDRSPDGISGIFEGLIAGGILAETLDPGALNAGVPADATALVVAGPREQLSTNEIEAIIAYLEGGGRLFLAANPRLNPRESFMTADDPLRLYLADSFGLAMGDDLVVDEANSFGDSINVISGEIVPHEATARLLDGSGAVFFGSRSVTVIPLEDQPDTRAGRAALVYSTADAYAETDLAALWDNSTYAPDAADPVGPLVLVAVAQNADTDARVVLTGDSDFLGNAQISYLSNRFFYTDSLAWLTQFFEQVETDIVTDPTRLPLTVRGDTMNTIFLVTAVIMPGIVLAVGVVVWNRRQRR